MTTQITPIFGAIVRYVLYEAYKYGRPYQRQNTNVDIEFNYGGKNLEFLIYNHDLVKEVDSFGKTSPLFLETYFLKEGLLFTDSEQWKRQRSGLKNEFTFEKLKLKFSSVQEVVNNVLNEFLELKLYEQPVPICHYLMKITGEVIFRQFLGKQQFRYKDGQLLSEVLAHLVYDIGTESLGIYHNLMLNIFGHKYYDYDFWLTPSQKKLKKRFIEFKNILKSIIDQKVQMITNTKDYQPQTTLDVILLDYIANPDQISYDEVQQQFLTFFFAGMDTTGTTNGMTFYALASNSKILEKMIQEHSNIPNLTFESLNQLEYTNAVIKETLRMWPVVSIAIPRLAKKDLYIGKYFLPKGSQVFIPHIVNHNCESFPNADDFNPERWFAPQAYHTYSYTPFSAGPRNCIGSHLAQMEMKVILYEFLKKVKPVLNDKIKIQFIQGLIFQPKDDRVIYLKKI